MEVKKEGQPSLALDNTSHGYHIQPVVSGNARKRAMIHCILIIVTLLCLYLSGFFMSDELLQTDFTNKNQAPSFQHIFGTDWMGRDVFYRTLKGFNFSMTVGVLGSLFSSVIAVVFGVIAASGSKRLDGMVSWLIDLMLGIPQLLLLILISVALGGGIQGVIIGLILTHWTGLARLVRNEVMKIRDQHYIQVSKKLGKSNAWIIRHHILPHIVPVFIVGLVLMFPHAIIHESALSFLGLGVPPEKASIGVMLSESLKYLNSGVWWAAIFPGIFLVLVVLLTDRFVRNLNVIFDSQQTT